VTAEDSVYQEGKQCYDQTVPDEGELCFTVFQNITDNTETCTGATYKGETCASCIDAICAGDDEEYLAIDCTNVDGGKMYDPCDGNDFDILFANCKSAAPYSSFNSAMSNGIVMFAGALFVFFALV
jgi:hypothetical protein